MGTIPAVVTIVDIARRHGTARWELDSEGVPIIPHLLAYHNVVTIFESHVGIDMNSTLKQDFAYLLFLGLT